VRSIPQDEADVFDLIDKLAKEGHRIQINVSAIGYSVVIYHGRKSPVARGKGATYKQAFSEAFRRVKGRE